MGAQHILNIKLQFEKLDKNLLNKHSKDLGGAIEEGMSEAAIAGGDALMNSVQTVGDAIRDFDWSSPIEGIKNVASAAARTIKEQFGLLSIPIMGLFASIAGNILSTWTTVQPNLVKMLSMMSKDFMTSEGAGVSMGTRVSKALEEINDVAFKTGQSINDVSDTYISLAQQRVPYEDLQNLTKYAILGSKALGANQEQLTNMIASLKVVGGVSSEVITGAGGILREFSKVQDAVGLTEQEMSGMIGTVSKVTQLMSTFGAVPKDIVAMTKATAQLTGMFGSLGLQADRASQIMEKLFDPTRIGENALLVSRMGMNMNEYLVMLRGGPVDQKKLTEGLVDAADEVNQMLEQTGNIYAANARAQMLGFSNAQEAIRIAKDGRASLAKIASGEADFEKSAAEGMSTMSDALSRFMNTIGAFFGKRLAKIFGLLTDLMGTLSEWWIKNEDQIDKLFGTLFKGMEDFLKNLNPEDIMKFFTGIIEGIGFFIGGIKDAIPFIIAFGAALLILKVAGPLTGMLSGLGKTISGLGSAAGGASSSMGSFSSSVGAGLQSFMQMAGVALVILAIGAAIFLIAFSLGFLAQQPWDRILMATIILVAFIAVLVGLGYFFTSPLGAIALLGMTAMAGVMLMLGGAVMMLGIGFALVAITIMDMAKGLEYLAGIAGMLKENFSNIVEPLATFGRAIGIMLLNMGGPLGILTLMLFAAQIETLGMGFYILAVAAQKLAGIGNLDQISKSFESLKGAIEAMTVGPFISDIEKVGAGFRNMAEGIITLGSSKLKQVLSDLSGTGASSLGTIISSIVGSMTKNAGLLVDFKSIGEAFESVAMGMYIFAQNAAGIASLSETLKTSAGNIGAFIKAIVDAVAGNEGKGWGISGDSLRGMGEGMEGLAYGLYILSSSNLEGVAQKLTDLAVPLKQIITDTDWKGGNMKQVGEGFKSLFEGLKLLPTNIPRLSLLAFDITIISAALVTFKEKASSASEEFVKLMNEINGAEPIRIISEDSDLGKMGSKKEEISIIRSLNLSIKESMTDVMKEVVDKLDELKASIEASSMYSEETSKAVKTISSMASAGGPGLKMKRT